MYKKFLSAILFGAFLVTSTGTFVSCKDYDDDIDNLQAQITSNKDAIAQIQAQIKSGQWVSNVTSTANGITVTLGNGQSYNITNGKDGVNGTNGTNGLTPQILVVEGAVYASYDNGATKTKLIDLSDLKGKDGKDPAFSVGEDGHLYVQYADDETTKRDLGISISGIYYVENGLALEIHMPMQSIEGEDEGYGVIKLPRAAAIVSLEALYSYGYKYIGTDDAGAAYVELNYGTATKDVTFNGKSYKKGQFLSSSSDKILVKINPVMTDPSLYSLYLTDSKGNSPYSIKNVDNYMTVDPISRAMLAPTPNKGLYQMTIGFADGTTKNNIPVDQRIA